MRHGRWLLALAIAWGCHGEAVREEKDPGAQTCVPASGAGRITLDGAQVFDDLQSALDAASPGAELRLCPGTYEGNFVATSPVRMVAAYDPTVTVLSGLSDFAPTLTVRGGTEIVGLTVRSGGGGVVMSSSGTLRVEDSRITGNRAEHGAGLIVAEDSTATLVRTAIVENFADVGGGGAWVRPGATLEITDGSVVSTNRAGEFGGGVWLQDAHLVGGVVTDNVLVWSHDSIPRKSGPGGDVVIEAEAFGGAGIALSGTGSVTGTEVAWNLGVGGGLSVSRGTGTLSDVWVHDNDGSSPLVYGAGGGLFVAAATVVNQGSTRFEKNTADDGGGAYVINGSVIGGTFTGNTADTAGGGIVVDGTIIGATFAENVASRGVGGLQVTGALLEDVVIRGNTAGAHNGGGLSTEGTVRLDGVTIEDNHAPELGGGIYMWAGAEASVEIVDSSIIGNHAGTGGGIHLYSVFWPLTLTLTDTRVIDNVAAETGGGLHIKDRVIVSGGEITGNTAASGGGAYVDTDGSLTVTATDLGTEQGENTPDDVATGSAAYHGYGPNASVTCDDEACAPAP